MPGRDIFASSSFCVAPMARWTDHYCRVFHRSLTRRALLYTEMLPADAVIHGARDKLLGFDPIEHPLALQLAGADPDKLAQAAHIGVQWGYDEINLNCGCPSPRVQSGRFGACMMREPELVARCVLAMRAVTGEVPVTVKCRIGLDDEPPCLFEFIDIVAGAGCEKFVVHARNAWLSGINPKENRIVPPLDYAIIAELKRRRPDLTIIINGGIRDISAAMALRDEVDGVMLGRAAYETPAILGTVDRDFFAARDSIGPFAAIADFRPFIERELQRGTRLHAMTRHLSGLFSGYVGARCFRRILSERAPGASGAEAILVLDEALAALGAASRSRAA